MKTKNFTLVKNNKIYNIFSSFGPLDIRNIPELKCFYSLVFKF